MRVCVSPKKEKERNFNPKRQCLDEQVLACSTVHVCNVWLLCVRCIEGRGGLVSLKLGGNQ